MVERGAVAGLGFGVVILEWGVKIDLSAPAPCVVPCGFHSTPILVVHSPRPEMSPCYLSPVQTGNAMPRVAAQLGRGRAGVQPHNEHTQDGPETRN